FTTGAAGGGTGNARIVSKAPAANKEWNFYRNNSSGVVQIEANKWGTTAGQWTASYLIALTTWTHILWTYSFSSTSNNPKMYANGVSQTINLIATPAGSLGSGGGEFAIGNNAGGGSGVRGFAGRIMHVAYWNRILSAGEAMGVYKNGPMAYSSGLRLYVPLFGVTFPEPTYAPQGDAVRTGTVLGATGGVNLSIGKSLFWS